MIDNMIKITPIDISYAGELSALAKNIYKEYYLHLWYPGGAEWYMNDYAYAVQTVAAEIADPGNLHFIIHDKDRALGYLKIRLRATLSGFEHFNSMEIERIYLHKEAAGKGIGKVLMNFSENIAFQYKKEMIFLKAMDTSDKAINFYRQTGYTKCGTLVLPFPLMKEAYRGMIIFKKNIILPHKKNPL